MNTITFPEPPIAGDEIELLLGILERTRNVLAWKCGGLDAAAMRVRLGPSEITLGGLLKHLALVEYQSFTTKVSGDRPGAPWNAVDWAADPNWDWHSAADDTPEELFALWREAVEHSRARVAEALTRGDLGQPVHVGDGNGRHANLRRIVLDMIDEYARHNGHADLIRESIDGVVGEDPPTNEA